MRDEIDRDKVASALKEKGATKKCHRCNAREFSVLKGYSSVSLGELRSSGHIFESAALPVVSVACNNCGAITQHATYGKTDSRFIGMHRSNLKSDLIEITEDKLENILMKHESKLGLKKAWIAPLGLLLTIVAPLISAEFKDALGVPKATWSAFFMLAADYCPPCGLRRQLFAS